MTSYQIFIAHTSDNEPFAFRLRDCLSNIVEFHPYLAQDYFSLGDSFKDRIQDAIQNCSFFICCLSKSALFNQWINQELGYACAVKKRKRNYHIIPLSRSDLVLKGMITRDSEDILFIDKYSEDMLFANIIFSIRDKIQDGHNSGTLNFRVKCKHCLDEIGLQKEYFVPVPESEKVYRVTNEGNTVWVTDCPFCLNRNYSNILTWNEVEG